MGPFGTILTIAAPGYPGAFSLPGRSHGCLRARGWRELAGKCGAGAAAVPSVAEVATSDVQRRLHRQLGGP